MVGLKDWLPGVWCLRFGVRDFGFRSSGFTYRAAGVELRAEG